MPQAPEHSRKLLGSRHSRTIERRLDHRGVPPTKHYPASMVRDQHDHRGTPRSIEVCHPQSTVQPRWVEISTIIEAHLDPSSHSMHQALYWLDGSRSARSSRHTSIHRGIPCTKHCTGSMVRDQHDHRGMSRAHRGARLENVAQSV